MGWIIAGIVIVAIAWFMAIQTSMSAATPQSEHPKPTENPFLIRNSPANGGKIALQMGLLIMFFLGLLFFFLFHYGMLG